MPPKKLKPKYSPLYCYPHTRGLGPRLWWNIRKLLGLSQTEMARKFGVTQDAIKYRENEKKVYTLLEITTLYKASQLPAEDFLELLEE